VSDAGNRDAGVHRVQAPQLQHDEEPEEEFGSSGVQQVLPVLSQAHRTQGIEVTRNGEMSEMTEVATCAIAQSHFAISDISGIGTFVIGQ
jgi:hypothetical protein